MKETLYINIIPVNYNLTKKVPNQKEQWKPLLPPIQMADGQFSMPFAKSCPGKVTFFELSATGMLGSHEW